MDREPPTPHRLLIQAMILRQALHPFVGPVERFRIAADRHRRLRAQRRHPQSLLNFEERVTSEHGEDGIIAEIFRRIGTARQFFAECAVGDGTQNNTRALLARGWSGLWVEGSADRARRARLLAQARPVTVRSTFVTAENFTGILQEAEVPREFDLLSLDIDGNDFWVWKALAGFSPRVVVIEYNASVPPGRHWVLPYDPRHVWRGSRRFGASLDALAALGKEKGYALVACDSSGGNAFFVRRDLCEDRFRALDGGSAYHYVPPNVWGRNFWLASSADTA